MRMTQTGVGSTWISTAPSQALTQPKAYIGTFIFFKKFELWSKRETDLDKEMVDRFFLHNHK